MSPKVLVVCPYPDLTTIITDVLAIEGYDVRITCKEETTLRELTADQPDLLIFGSEMYLSTYRHLPVWHETKRLSQMPVLVVSSLSSGLLQTTAGHLGNLRPAHSDRLIEAVSHLLGRELVTAPALVPSSHKRPVTA